MPLFWALVVVGAIALWYLLAKFFNKIGDIASKSAKPFKENSKENKLEGKGEDSNGNEQ